MTRERPAGAEDDARTILSIDPAIGASLRGQTLLFGDGGAVVLGPSTGSLGSASDELITRQAVAEWLRTSVRWVERHITPLAQRRRGGRAWYSRADVERQIAAFTTKKADPVVALPHRPDRRAMSGRMARAVVIGDALRRRGERPR